MKPNKNPITELKNDFDRWGHLNEHGGSDPFYADGANMWLVRNHIINSKERVEEYCSQNNLPLPEIYYRETPPEVDMNYMARPDEIREAAKKSLAIYEADPNYLKLKDVVGLQDKDKRQMLENVLGYVSGLRKAIEEDDLISMRRHRNAESYLESFESMLKNLTEEDFCGQLSLFEEAR